MGPDWWWPSMNFYQSLWQITEIGIIPRVSPDHDVMASILEWKWHYFQVTFHKFPIFMVKTTDLGETSTEIYDALRWIVFTAYGERKVQAFSHCEIKKMVQGRGLESLSSFPSPMYDPFPNYWPIYNKLKWRDCLGHIHKISSILSILDYGIHFLRVYSLRPSVNMLVKEVI